VLADWLWSFVVTLGVWLEAAGLACAFTRLGSLRRARVRMAFPPLLALALSFASLAAFYFTASLLGWVSPTFHGIVLVAGAAFAFYEWRRVSWENANAGEPHLHLKIARSLSPMSWRRAGPWLVLPVVWAALSFTDTLVPHDHREALAYHLLAARRWYELGGQKLDPFTPLTALASVWEGLYFHVQSLLHGIHGAGRIFSAPHRVILVRAQLASQMLHFTAGQCLSALVLAWLIRPFIRAGWDVLVHSAGPTAGATRRHQLGMASTVAMPASLFFAWLACGEPLAGWSAPLGRNDWGATLCVFGAVGFLVQERAAAGWFLAGLAVAMNRYSVFALPGLLLITGLETRRNGITALAPAAAAFVAGLAPWALRNLTQADALIYPPWGPQFTAGPGWIPLPRELPRPDRIATLLIKLFVVIGVTGAAIYLWRKRFEIHDRAVRALALLAALGATAFVLAPHAAPAVAFSAAPYLVASAIVIAALGMEFLLTFTRAPALAPLIAWTSRLVPYLWLLVGLAAVPLPIHVLWQHLSYAGAPADAYLEEYHEQFRAKHWASVHLPATARLAWTNDDTFYYLEQQAAAVPETALLRDALAVLPTPQARARALCELGFDTLAWEEHRHGTEVAGLASWLRLYKGTVLHVSGEVTLFDLEPACKSPL
jgi:hypothetical protein